jgi:hypothetical protein
MEDQIFTPQEPPTLDDVMNTEQEDVVYTPLDNVIDDEIHTQTEPSDVQIPESEEIETGEPIEVTIEDQIITPKKNRIDFQGYELDNISEADNENDVPSIKQVREIVEEVESEKQDKLTAGDNITITSDNVISATNTTYTAGDNISISDENVISATDTTYTAGDNISISDENVISATDTTYTAGNDISISDNVISYNSTYSTTEQVVGTWIDGKTIYRKVIHTVFNGANVGSNREVVVNFGFAPDTVVKFEGTIQYISTSDQKLRAFSAERLSPKATISDGFSWYMSNNQLKLETPTSILSVDYTWNMICYYTK